LKPASRARRSAHRWVRRQAIRQGIEAGEFTAAAEADKRHLFALTRFKANGRAGGNVEAHAERRRSIGVQRLVHFEEMIVRADLNRTIAGIDHGERGARPASGKLDFAFCGENRAGLQRVGGGAGFRPDRLVHGDELGPVGKDALDLKDRQHGGDAGHHVAGGQDRRSERHQVGNAFALARALEDFVGDDGHSLGMVELKPLGAAFSRQLCRRKDGEAFKLGWRKQHRDPLTRKQTQMRAGVARGRGVDPRHEALDFGVTRHRT
jgi:hypothetical protein